MSNIVNILLMLLRIKFITIIMIQKGIMVRKHIQYFHLTKFLYKKRINNAGNSTLKKNNFNDTINKYFCFCIYDGDKVFHKFFFKLFLFLVYCSVTIEIPHLSFKKKSVKSFQNHPVNTCVFSYGAKNSC